MKVLVAHNDGSQTKLFEKGDRVRFTRDHGSVFGFGKTGDLGFVTRAVSPDHRNASIQFVDVRTDEMIAGEWGTLTVPPWFLELA